MEPPQDIEAEVTYLQASEGGRSTPARQGYRALFNYDGANWITVQNFPDVDEASPGSTLRVIFSFITPDKHVGRLHAGKKFSIYEGSRIVATGTVTKIIDLEESAKKRIEKE